MFTIIYIYILTYFRWSLCTLYLLACQTEVTVGDSGLSSSCLCHVFRALINSLVCWVRFYIVVDIVGLELPVGKKESETRMTAGVLKQNPNRIRKRRLKRMVYITTKPIMQMFGVGPFYKLQNNT